MNDHKKRVMPVFLSVGFPKPATAALGRKPTPIIHLAFNDKWPPEHKVNAQPFG